MTSRVRSLVTVAGVVATAVTAVGCGEDFDPYTRLTSLRVLAIKSEVMTEPANASGGFQVSPGPGQTATLTPFVFVPAGDVIDVVVVAVVPAVGLAQQRLPMCIRVGRRGDDDDGLHRARLRAGHR